jgi:hypothetical protein
MTLLNYYSENNENMRFHWFLTYTQEKAQKYFKQYAKAKSEIYLPASK